MTGDMHFNFPRLLRVLIILGSSAIVGMFFSVNTAKATLVVDPLKGFAYDTFDGSIGSAVTQTPPSPAALGYDVGFGVDPYTNTPSTFLSAGSLLPDMSMLHYNMTGSTPVITKPKNGKWIFGLHSGAGFSGAYYDPLNTTAGVSGGGSLYDVLLNSLSYQPESIFFQYYLPAFTNVDWWMIFWTAAHAGPDMIDPGLTVSLDPSQSVGEQNLATDFPPEILSTYPYSGALDPVYRWDFGDGSGLSGCFSDPTPANSTHTYAAPGVYTATLYQIVFYAFFDPCDADGPTIVGNPSVTTDTVRVIVGNPSLLDMSTSLVDIDGDPLDTIGETGQIVRVRKTITNTHATDTAYDIYLFSTLDAGTGQVQPNPADTTGFVSCATGEVKGRFILNGLPYEPGGGGISEFCSTPLGSGVHQWLQPGGVALDLAPGDILDIEYTIKITAPPIAHPHGSLSFASSMYASYCLDSGCTSTSETLSIDLLVPFIAPSLEISKHYVDFMINASQVFDTLIIITNAGDGPAYNVTVTDQVEPSFIQGSVIYQDDNCDGSVDSTVSPSATYFYPTFAPGTVCLRYVTTVKVSPDVIDNTYTDALPVDSAATIFGEYSDGSSISFSAFTFFSDPFAWIHVPDLQTTKSASSGAAFIGDTLTYTVTVKNEHLNDFWSSLDGAAHHVQVVDTLPQGFVYVPGSTSPTLSCTSVTSGPALSPLAEPVISGQTLTWTDIEHLYFPDILEAEAECTFTYQVELTKDVDEDFDLHTNTAVATGLYSDLATAIVDIANSATDVVDIDAHTVEPHISLSATPNWFMVDEFSTATILVRNDGDQPAVNAVISLSIDGKMELTSLSSTIGTCDLITKSCLVGLFPANGSMTITAGLKGVSAGINRPIAATFDSDSDAITSNASTLSASGTLTILAKPGFIRQFIDQIFGDEPPSPLPVPPPPSAPTPPVETPPVVAPPVTPPATPSDPGADFVQVLLTSLSVLGTALMLAFATGLFVGAGAGLSAGLGFGVYTLAAVGIYILYLFTEPLRALLGGRRKGWGVVYNSLSKKPIDLAIVRLFNAEGKLLKTRITDKNGRFQFLIDEDAEVRLQVVKNGFTFPSTLLNGVKEDSAYDHLYYGEPLQAKAKDPIIPNIPMDPPEIDGSVDAFNKRRFKKRLGKMLSLIGAAVSVVTAIMYPSWLTIGLVVLHVLLYMLFARLAGAKLPPAWGRVFDVRSKNPLPATIARIFDKQYNRLLDMTQSDPKGRYSFLADKSVFYATFEHPDYAPQMTPTIDLTKKEEGDVIQLDIEMKEV